jgi:hypothetical protein
MPPQALRGLFLVAAGEEGMRRVLAREGRGTPFASEWRREQERAISFFVKQRGGIIKIV